MKPDHVQAQYGLAQAQRGLGRFDEAVHHFRIVVRLKPGHGKAHYNLGSTLLMLGKVDSAIPHFEAALKIKPDAAQIHHRLGTALEVVRRFQEARSSLRRCGANQPERCCVGKPSCQAVGHLPRCRRA